MNIKLGLRSFFYLLRMIGGHACVHIRDLLNDGSIALMGIVKIWMWLFLFKCTHSSP